MKEYISLFFKGVGMGAANVIPGVSGGTIALITGIFEKLIHSIKSFDLVALRQLFSGKLGRFANHINLDFLIAVFLGIAVSIFTLAKLLGYLFDQYPVYIWSYFFGLILASVFFVGKRITRLTVGVAVAFITGTAVALLIALLSPATENSDFYYLFLCGIVAICSMILPGLSGSFVLILMGNYELVFIKAVNDLDMKILGPVVLGSLFGLIAFSHFLSWIFKRFKDLTIALLTGFILGSLSILWPWKEDIYRTDASGMVMLKSNGEPIIQGYERILPDSLNGEVIIAICLVVTGILSIWLLEKLAEKKGDNSD
jgi:putative membrane protein